MKVLDCGPLSVCEDCAHLIANDEADPEHRRKFRLFQEWFDTETHLVMGDEVRDFTMMVRCDGCGSFLAGSRHEVFAIGE